MDMFAYWTYAFLQGIILVVWLKIKDQHINILALSIFTIAAPFATVAIVYVLLGDLLDWLQLGGTKK